MQLRATAGAYAGQIREYAFTAAQAALKTGAAERVSRPAPSAPVRSTPPPAATSAKRRTR